MFKIHAIGNNQVSMKMFSVCLLLCMGVMCHAQGFEQSTLDEYLYGPYFNDLAIEPLDESAIGTFFNKKTCNEARLTQLHQAFFEPGAWRNVTSNKDLHNVVVCAWGGQQNATHLMEKLVYAQQLKEIQDNDQIAITYSNEDGITEEKFNPNGSQKNIAGIFNKKKNVLGMMPHPERMIDKSLSSEDGSIFFKNLINNIK